MPERAVGGEHALSRAWLKPFAAGAGLVAAASIGGWAFASFHRPSDRLIVKFTKPTGLHADPQPLAPAPKFETASDYLVALAKQCGARSWTLETGGMANDADDVAWLELDLESLPDQSFNCLVRATKPPLITIERKSK